MTDFKPNEEVIWKPRRARSGHYGHPIALAPVPCRVVSGPDRADNYLVEVSDSKLRAILGRSSHLVKSWSLIRMNKKEINT